MAATLRLGMIGLDTSHCEAFTGILHDDKNPHHIPGARVVAAVPGGSKLCNVSYSRVANFTKAMQEKFGLEMRDSIDALARDCDAFLLESVDGRQHLEQFTILAKYGKPVFIDKPLACSRADAEAIAALAAKTKTPVMSASAVRFAAGAGGGALRTAAAIHSCEAFGSMGILEDYPTYFWYGIHSADLLFSYLGKGCREVRIIHEKDMDLIVGHWDNGRLGTVRGLRTPGAAFGATVFAEDGVRHAIAAGDPPYYAMLLRQVIPFFQTGKAPIDLAETVEIIAFLEAAGASLAQNGATVRL